MRESAFRVKGKYLGQKLSLFGHKSKTPILKIFLKGELKIREIATKHQGALKSLLSSPERFFVRIFNFTSTLLCGLIAIFFQNRQNKVPSFYGGEIGFLQRQIHATFHVNDITSKTYLYIFINSPQILSKSHTPIQVARILHRSPLRRRNSTFHDKEYV